MPEHVLDAVLAEFPDPNRGDWFQFDSETERKLATSDDTQMGPVTRHVLAQLNSAAFIDFLERLTKIEALVPDPHFVGGGLHQIEPGGHLKVHADFNFHPRTKLERRLNVLIYLNRDWKDEYGGAFELWDKKMNGAVKKVMPHFNRCVVFSTTSTSFHGHPEPLACPEGETRKSMALYYYSKDRPVHEQAAVHNTLWAAREPLAKRMKSGAKMFVPPILLQWWRRARARRA
jgi:2-oxoglutarate-Fe(II)-dependent oxygenase superfamily protein